LHSRHSLFFINVKKFPNDAIKKHNIYSDIKKMPILYMDAIFIRVINIISFLNSY